VAPVRSILAIGGGNVGLAAEDRLDARGLGLLVEVDRAEHVAMVGDRNGFHALAEDLREQVGQPDGAIEQAVGGMQMQMRELGHQTRSSMILDICSGSTAQPLNSTAFLQAGVAAAKILTRPQLVHRRARWTPSTRSLPATPQT